jgi:hypothetical protein
MAKQTPLGRLLAFAACATALPPLPLLAAEPITLTIKDHRFTPDQVAAPAGVPDRGIERGRHAKRVRKQ